jgi:CO/xanthine dehydrogenase FAD-binding subunit
VREFAHINASSLDEMVSWLRGYGLKVSLIAGGRDLLEKATDESNAEATAEVTLSAANPLKYSRYKIQVAKILVKRAILACM